MKKPIESIKQKAIKAIQKAIIPLSIIAGVAFLILVGDALKAPHPSKFTVMITNLKGNSGGSGSIVETSISESKILTNAHVCVGALKEGGKVRKVNGEEYRVTGYHLSDDHDLCLVTVAADLKHSARLASSPPKPYDEATISGHPSLLPNLLTKGHFSGRMIIEVMVGARKCTARDAQDPKTGILCVVFGMVPIVKSFESVVASPTIMPGSSGSPVLNSDNEISGVVFAGSMGLSYAFIVPYESVRNFLLKEMKKKEQKEKLRPWDNPPEDEKSQEEELAQKLADSVQKACNDPNHKEKLKEICGSSYGRHI